MKKRKRKRQSKEEEKTESLPRKDDKLKYVIINNGTDKKAAKHFVSVQHYKVILIRGVVFYIRVAAIMC